MSKRFFLILGVGVLMALTGVILSLRPDLFGSWTEGSSDPAHGPGAGPKDASPRRGGNGFSPTAGRTVPPADITVDGQMSDWVRIDQSSRHRRDVSDTGVYRCRTVEFARARDGRYLYVLLELDHGVNDRFQAARARAAGRLFSGNLPDIDFRAGGMEFSLRVATGYSIIRSPSPTKPDKPIEPHPLVRLVVFRRDTNLTSVFSASSRDRSGTVDFGGKIIEVKLPLASLGLKKVVRVDMGFE